MTRRSNAIQHDHYGRVGPQIVDSGLEGFLPLTPPEPAHAPEKPELSLESARRTEQRQKRARLKAAGDRRWIEAGKPIALAVVTRDGKVTAATWRVAAKELPNVLPPNYGDQRALSYVHAIFEELVEDGHLEKVRHPNGAPVKVMDPVSRNPHCCYIRAVKR